MVHYETPSDGKTSRVLMLDSPGNLSWVSLNPGEVGPDEVYAETHFSLISTGTEVAAWRGLPPLRPGPVYPRLLGYCNVARVMERGKDVSLKAGDYILTAQSHRSSFKCKEKDIYLNLGEVGEEDLKLASTLSLYHLGHHCLLVSGYQPGHRLGVVGLGPLGLCTIASAAYHGAEVIGFSDQKLSRGLASDLGACHVLEKSGAENSEFLSSLDIVVLTTNSWSDWLLSLKLVRCRGQIIVLSFPGRGEPPPEFNPLSSEYFYQKQMTLRSCGHMPNQDVPPEDLRFTLKRNLSYLWGLIRNRKLRADFLISASLPHTSAREAYERLEKRIEGEMSILLRWKS